MIYGRRRQAMDSPPECEKPRPFPLILPNGDSVDMEIFESCDYKISEYMKKYAFFIQNPSKICLNYLDAAEANSLPTWNSKANPAEKICTILSELITKIREQYPHSISADEMVLLRDSDEICTILKEAIMLRNVPFDLLKTAEDTTCFLINLTNLMFLHALIFKPNESMESFTSMDWTARQMYCNSVGYILGKYGFVSLYDLHSFLLKYPSISTPSKFSSLKFSSDARIPFAIAQLFALSPKIDAIHPSNLDKYLESSEIEYHTVVSALNAAAPSSVPIPLFLKIERAFCDDQLLPHTFQNHPIIMAKLNLLSPHVGKLSPEEIVQKGIFMVNDPQVEVHFSYSNLELKSLHRVLWKFCTHHASFFHCCTDFVMTIKMHMLENRYLEFPDENIEKIKQEIDIFDIYKEIGLFAAQLMEEEFDSDDCPEEMRCLNNILLFIVGENENFVADENNQFANLLQILRLSIKRNQEFSHSLAKIRACQKILMLDPEVRKEYTSWFDLFIEQPSKLLSLLTYCENLELASEFVEAQFVFNPFYNFQKEVFAVYLSQLCVDGETSLLKRNILRMDENSLYDMMDILVNQQCQIIRLQILVCCILQHFELSTAMKPRFYAWWMSFRMLTAVPEFEQYLFHDVLRHPDLIVEQIIMNRCPNIFKRVMNITRKPLIVNPAIEKLENEFRKKVDELILFYAEKALFFTKDLSIKDESDVPVKKFIPPKKIPTIEEWVPDEKAPNCMLCDREFTVFTRRHHCRRCGRVVCYFCSDHKLEIFKFELKVRVCEECYEYEKPFEIVINDILCSESPSKTNIVWRLTGDSESNKNLRRQITYENGPDIVFCMALVEQHTPNDIVARFLCVKAEEMTKILRHRLIYSANFDYDQVAMCARSLTYASKLLYSNLNDVRAVRRCEEMANEIELLKLCSLVSYVPQDPNKPMRDVEQWSMIKDRLTNVGEWMKALEIASKIGADTKSIWFLWGISLLKSGDWISAREKFKYSSIRTNPSALRKILEIIHSSVEKGPKFEEGLHYIRLYGNKLSLYQYHVEFCKFDEALDIAFHNNISPELFSDTVVFPLVKNNGWESLLRRMHELDPSHQYWVEHVKFSYKFCQDELDIDILYEFAKFINDYYHMSICSAKLFSRGSRSYLQLKNNIKYLNLAIENMIMFKEQLEETRIAKNVSQEKVEKVLNDITMQIEINFIIWRAESVARQKFENAPTIFNIQKTGDQLVGLLVQAISDIDKAFLFTLDLVNEYSLDCGACYCRATFGLGLQNRTNNIHRLISLVMNWMKGNVVLDDNEAYISILDALYISAIRGRPEYPIQFANRITDTVQKIDVLIETDQLKDALRFVARLENPYSYLKKLHEIAKCRNLTWLNTMIFQYSPEFNDETDESVVEKSEPTPRIEPSED